MSRQGIEELRCSMISPLATRIHVALGDLSRKEGESSASGNIIYCMDESRSPEVVHSVQRYGNPTPALKYAPIVLNISHHQH